MTKAYWINTFTAVHDDAKLKSYVRLAGPAIEDAGGRFLAHGDVVHTFEGGTFGLATLIEFSSADAAVAAYSSPGYQAALAALDGGADRAIRIIEALPDV